MKHVAAIIFIAMRKINGREKSGAASAMESACRNLNRGIAIELRTFESNRNMAKTELSFICEISIPLAKESDWEAPKMKDTVKIPDINPADEPHSIAIIHIIIATTPARSDADKRLCL